jgi:hypothetical protein
MYFFLRAGADVRRFLVLFFRPPLVCALCFVPFFLPWHWHWHWHWYLVCSLLLHPPCPSPVTAH